MTSCSLTLENKHLLSEQPSAASEGARPAELEAREMGLSPALNKGLAKLHAERPVGQAASSSAPLQHITQTGHTGYICPFCTLTLIFAQGGAADS